MIDIQYETINTHYILDPEDYFISKFKKEGYECCRTRVNGQTYDVASCSNDDLRGFLKTESRNGIPDLVVFNKDKFFFVEVKTTRDTLRKHQLEWIKNHPNIKVIVYYLTQTLTKEEPSDNKIIDKKTQIIHEISKQNDIRAAKAEYRIILDVLQDIYPVSIQELLEEINDTYECEIFTYKQLWSEIRSLSDLGIVNNNNTIKKISINPEYIFQPPTHTNFISFHLYFFSISIIFMIVSIVTKTLIEISVTMVITGIIYLFIHRFHGEKF